MTVAQKRQITVGLITTLLGASILGLLGWTRVNVILRPEFEARAVRLESDIHAVERRVESKLDRLLDVVCDKEPTKPRACE